MRRTSSAKGSQCSNLTKTALRILLSFEHFGPFLLRRTSFAIIFSVNWWKRRLSSHLSLMPSTLPAPTIELHRSGRGNFPPSSRKSHTDHDIPRTAMVRPSWNPPSSKWRWEMNRHVLSFSSFQKVESSSFQELTQQVSKLKAGYIAIYNALV